MGISDQYGNKYKNLVLGLLGSVIAVFGFIYVYWGSALFNDIPNSVPEVDDPRVLSRQDRRLKPTINYLPEVEVASASRQPFNDSSPNQAQDQPKKTANPVASQTSEPDHSPGLTSRVKKVLTDLF